MKILILTPVSVEFRAVRAHLTDLQPCLLDDSYYETGRFSGLHGNFQVILRETGPKNSIVALAVEQAIRHFAPSIALLVGIAGGVKDVELGDIVVGTKAYGYEAGKETAYGIDVRPDVMPFSRYLLAAAKQVAHASAWPARSRCGPGGARTFFGPIASADKVVVSRQSKAYRHIVHFFNDTLALEMESIGFAHAACNRPGLHALNIRAISDLLDHKSSGDAQGLQEMAADRAAAFAFELIHQLSPAHILQPKPADGSPELFARDPNPALYPALFR